jgi:hypothetical protein
MWWYGDYSASEVSMKRCWIALGMLVVMACGESVAPELESCTGACAGLRLEIDAFRVVLPPGRNTVFNMDTLQAKISITNRSGVRSDSFAVEITNFIDASAFTMVSPLNPGQTIHREIEVPYPVFARRERARDSLFVEVYRVGLTVPFTYQFHDAAVSQSYAFIPSTFRLEAPDTLWFPATNQAFHLVINNPSPRPVPADSMWVCVWDIDYCFVGNIETPMFPSVAAGQGVRLPISFNVAKPTDRALDWDDLNFDLVVCYGGFFGRCAADSTVSVPRYENFCSVPPLTPGNERTITVTGHCGRGPTHGPLEMASLEVQQGRTYRITASASRNFVIEFRNQARQRMSVGISGLTNPRVYTFTAQRTERVFLFMWLPAVAESYTLRVEES